MQNWCQYSNSLFVEDRCLRNACRAVLRGGIIAYPTESVYGIGCNASDADAVCRLRTLKMRLDQKGLIIIGWHFSQLEAYCAPISPLRHLHILSFWPGPYTWVFPRSSHCPDTIAGKGQAGVAVRVTAHPVASFLCQTTGEALVSTSANPANLSPARSDTQVKKYFQHSEITVVKGELGGSIRPTPIRDALTDELLRPAH